MMDLHIFYIYFNVQYVICKDTATPNTYKLLQNKCYNLKKFLFFDGFTSTHILLYFVKDLFLILQIDVFL
jgi:hypothetical protein